MLQSFWMVVVIMSGVWLLSILLKDASVVDIAWGLGFVVIAWTAYLLTSQRRNIDLLLPLLTTIWGVRLSGYLAWRNIGKGEDYRYRSMRQRYGKAFPLVSLFTVFALQGGIMWIVALPIQAALGRTTIANSNYNWLTLVGTVVWTVGFLFEACGDLQLANFKSRPENKGQVLQTGLWRYTRHPNYFGDFLVWWGIFLIAASLSGVWWTVISPLLMSYLLLRVSGVALLEKSLVTSKPDYGDYVAKTNAFFPWPPK